MKTTRPVLVFILAAGATLFAADETPRPKISDDNPAAQKTSANVSQQLQASRPKYDPTAAAARVAPAEPKPGDPVKPLTREEIARLANPDNAEIIELPKMTIKQKPRPRLTPDVMATDKGLAELNAKGKTTELDRALNKFTLPLFGVSAEERAREESRRQKKAEMDQEVAAITQALEQTSPSDAAALRNAAAKP